MSTGARVVRAQAPHALARACAATAVVVIGACSAHTWAGGTVPTGPGLALVAAVVLAAGLLVFTREVPAWALLPAVGAAQLGLHETFGLVAQNSHAVHSAGHSASHTAAVADPGWTWQMVSAHAFVTLLTAVLWWAGRRAASYVVVLRQHPSLPVVVRARTHRALDTVPTSLVHLVVAPRRGPPRAVRPT